MSNESNKKIGKITNILLDVLICIFGVILLITIYNIIQVKVLKNDYSNFFGYSVFEVQTGSMKDEINPGDWIIIHNENDFGIGDIVTYKQDEEYITHRIVETYKETYITKGDANNSKDDPISKDQIIGKVVKTLPHFGILRKTIFNPAVLITLIITVYIFNFIFKKDIKKNKSEKEKIVKEKKEKPVKEKKEKIKKEKPVKVKKEKIKKEKKVKLKKEKNKNEEIEKVEIVKEEIKLQDNIEKENDIHVEQVNNIDEELKSEVNLSEEKINNYDPEELDKTMYFRAITVDKNEINNTKEEIKKNTKEEVIDKKTKKIEKEVELTEEELEKETSIIQKKSSKKFKNAIDKIMFMKQQELNDIILILNNNEKTLTNEVGIRNSFIKAYIDVRYYNYCGDVNASYTNSNMNTKVSSTLKSIAEKLITEYKGTDTKYGIKVAKVLSMFMLISYIDKTDAEDFEDENFKEIYKKKIEKYLLNLINESDLKQILTDVKKTQKKYFQLYKHVLTKLETNTFTLHYETLDTRKNMYALNLEHNISFSKVYSDYIVDKAYTEDIIAEDKVIIELNLLSIELVNNMLSANFKNKYMLYIPETIYEKENKLSKIKGIMDDEYIKNNIYILIHYENLIKNKKMIKELKKDGYKFAVIFNNTVEVKETNQSILSIVDYLFADKKKVDTTKLLSSIHFDTKGKFIYEDIEIKVENYGGE